MEDRAAKKNEAAGVDVRSIFETLLKKAWIIALVCVFSTALAVGGTLALITPQYQSSAMFYVNNSNRPAGGGSLSMSSSDISAAKALWIPM